MGGQSSFKGKRKAEHENYPILHKGSSGGYFGCCMPSGIPVTDTQGQTYMEHRENSLPLSTVNDVEWAHWALFSTEWISQATGSW